MARKPARERRLDNGPRGASWARLCLILAIGLAASRGVGAAVCSSSGEQKPVAKPAEKKVVTIGRIDDLGSSAEYSWLGQTLPLLVRAGLEGSGELEIVVDDSFLKHAGGNQRDPEVGGLKEAQNGDRGWVVAGNFFEYLGKIKLELRITGGTPRQTKVFSRIAAGAHLLSEFGGVLAEVRAWLVAASPTRRPRQVAVLCFTGDSREARRIGKDLALSLAANFTGMSKWIALPFGETERFCRADNETVFKALLDADAVLSGKLELVGGEFKLLPRLWLRVPDAELEMITLSADRATGYGRLEKDLMASAAEFMNALGDEDAEPNRQLLMQNAADAPGYLELLKNGAARSNQALRAVLLQRALAKEPQNLTALVLLGKLRLQQMKLQAAEHYFTQARQLKLTDIGVLEAFGDLYIAREEYERAAVSYEQAVKIATRKGDLYLKLGESYYLAEDYDHARKALEQSVNEDGSSGDGERRNDAGTDEGWRCGRARTLTALGHVYRAQRHDEQAIAVYERALHAIADYGEAAVSLRTLYLQRATRAVNDGKWELANAALDMALKYRPTGEVYELAAYVLNSRNSYQQVVDLQRRAAAENVLSAVFDDNVIYALLMLGRFSEALEYCDKAIERLPRAPLLYRDKVAVLYRLHRAKEGLAVLQGAIRQVGTAPELTLEEAMLLAFTADYEGALRSVEEVDISRLHGWDLAHFFWVKASVVEMAHGCGEAIGWYEKAVATGPEDADFHVGKAFCLNELGRYGEAVAAADLALEKRPGYLHALNHKAYALYHLGNAKDARTLSEQVVAKERDYSLGHYNRARILAADGVVKDAIDELALAVTGDPGLVLPLAKAAPEFAPLRNREDFVRALIPP